jgi:uncharacterized protein
MAKYSTIFGAIFCGDAQEYSSMISSVDINVFDVTGMSLLHTAISSRQPEIALDLIKRSIDVNLQDKNLQTGLHYLGFYPYYPVAEAILQHGGNVEIQDKYGNRPLWYAVMRANGEYNFVRLLLKYKATPNSINKVGKTPISVAIERNDARMIEILNG